MGENYGLMVMKHFSYLVGDFNHDFYFPFHIWDVIFPIDELIFFKMVKTTNQFCTLHDAWRNHPQAASDFVAIFIDFLVTVYCNSARYFECIQAGASQL